MRTHLPGLIVTDGLLFGRGGYGPHEVSGELAKKYRVKARVVSLAGLAVLSQGERPTYQEVLEWCLS